MPASQQFGAAALILGESHANALAKAICDSGVDNFVAIDVRNRAAGATGGSKIDSKSFYGFRPQHLFLAFGGTEYNIVGLIESAPKFDFVWPPFTDFIDDRCLIPSLVIEAILAERIKPAIKRAIGVREQFSCRVHAIAPPPPFLQLDERARLPSVFAPILDVGISPATVRRKFYAVQCKVMRAAYAALGIDLIDAPPASMDADGFLLRSLWNKDPTHGNAAYGRLMIEHLKEYLDV